VIESRDAESVFAKKNCYVDIIFDSALLLKIRSSYKTTRQHRLL